ncbi:MAG: hypothetical protein H5T84_06690, partial [Thermoleophilia bacterium]|nr:hypothetical protein [Thermoleophilia bacterium]
NYFERSEERAHLFRLLSELVLELLSSPLTEAQFSLLLRQLLMWCAAALDGPHADAYDDSLLAIARTLHDLLPHQPQAFLERDGLVQDLVRRVRARAQLIEPYTRLYRDLLLLGYQRIRERLSLPQWAFSGQAELTDAAAVAERFAFLAAEELDKLIDRVQKSDPADLLSAEFPTFSDILNRAIDSVFRIENLEDRFAVCLYFLKDDTLGYRQNEVMADLVAVVRQLMKPERKMDVERILSRLTRFFRQREDQFLLMRFQCYEAIGVAIGEAGNEQAADHLIEDVLSWRFQYPDIRGATDEWETVVNPYHLPKIRCWMRIIESNPALYERLAAALNVQLRLGGVYIADTDLFQRDVSRFLNADIRPIYFVAKQLLRAFPVYFNEVGAEGELRAVSTEIDEICGRRDTLMHFLRKQSHAESSNRLVDFSREVLRYWATLDPSGLEPYVSPNTLAAIRREQEWAVGPHAVLMSLWNALKDGGTGPDTGRSQEPGAVPGPEDLETFLDQLLELQPAALEELLARVNAPDDGGPDNRRRVALMVRTYQLLAQKYSLSADNVGPAVSHHLQLNPKTRLKFTSALASWQANPTPQARDRLLDASLAVLEELKAIILSPVRTTAVENIYQKRHIAAGIPSMYGNYTEPKFDALGLSFRVEKLVSRLLEDLVSEGMDTYVTRESLRRMAAAIRRFERALAVDGVDSRNLAANLRLLEASFSSRNFTFHQYHNIFQFLAGSVTELS